MSQPRESRILSDVDDSYEVGLVDANQERQGLWKQFAADGQLLSECEYENGLRHGVFKRFEKGVLVFERIYFNAKRIGFYHEYYPNGDPKEEGETLVDGTNIVKSWWDINGFQTLVNGNGYKFDEYGSEDFRSIYKKTFTNGRKVAEEKITAPSPPTSARR